MPDVPKVTFPIGYYRLQNGEVVRQCDKDRFGTGLYVRDFWNKSRKISQSLLKRAQLLTDYRQTPKEIREKCSSTPGREGFTLFLSKLIEFGYVTVELPPNFQDRVKAEDRLPYEIGFAISGVMAPL